MRGLLAAALVAVLFGAAAQPARAQFLSEPGQDLRRDRQQLPERTLEKPTPARDFEIALTLPLLLTDNALSTTAGDANATSRGDVHFNPDIFVKWAHQFEQFRLSASADASVDRFFSETEEDEDVLYGTVEAALTDGRRKGLVPYLGYSVEADLRPDFRTKDDVLHTFYAGVSRTWSLAPADEPGALGWRSLTLDVSGGRRLSDPGEFQNKFAMLAGSVSLAVARDLTVSFEPTFRVRWYDRFEDEFRRDYRLSGIVRAIWTPPWLTGIVPSAELSATLGFLKNFSTRADERFSQWEGGPAIRLAWRF